MSNISSSNIISKSLSHLTKSLPPESEDNFLDKYQKEFSVREAKNFIEEIITG